MSLESVLLTGATGNVGAVLLEQLLKNGITVHVVLRSFAKSKEFLEHKYHGEVAAGKLHFVEIEDMTIQGVFDTPAKAVSAIIHVATPLPTSDFMETMIKPTWSICENILEAANRSATVKRVIVTGSIVSIAKLPDCLGENKTFSENDFNLITVEEALTNQSNAYQYSKVSSEKKAWEYMAKSKRPFDLVFILAPSIIGRSIQRDFKPRKGDLGGMSAIYREVFDRKAIGSLLPFVMDVDDVARTHVKSLTISSVPGNTRYLVIGAELDASQLAGKLREEYPELQHRIPEPDPVKSAAPPAKYDISRANRVFGVDWVHWWDSSKATVDDILAYEAAHPVIV